MARTEQEIRDVVAYSQRPLVTEQAVESSAIEFLLIICGTNKTIYLETRRQLQQNYFRDDEAIQKIVWLAIDESWQQFHGVTYETLSTLVQREITANGMVLMQHHIAGLFTRSNEGLLYAIANPDITVSGTNSELARDTLRRLVIARGVFSPMRRIMQTAGQNQVPAELYSILTSATKVHMQANAVSELPVVDMAPEFGSQMASQIELVSSGTQFIDTALGGQRDGEVFGILGPTGGGKTTLGVHLAVSNANLCWVTGQTAGKRPKFVIYITAEESAVLLRPRVWSAFFRMQRGRAAMPDPFSIMTTPDTLLPYERDDQRGQSRVMSESERYVLRRPILNTCFAVLDISGSAEFPNAGTGYIDELEAHITRLIEARDGQELSMVVIDYAGIIVQRHMEFNGTDEDKRRILLKYFGNNCKRQIAERFKCAVWVLHQLNGDVAAGPGTATKRITHSEASDSKSFAENLVACGVLGNADPNHGIRLLNWSKTRNKANETVVPTMLKIHSDFSLMMDVSDQYVVSTSGSGFMSTSEAASVGIAPDLQRMANRPVIESTTVGIPVGSNFE